MGELKPYPEYKDSNLPWLGKIPSHWEKKRAKFIFREVEERSITGNELRLAMSQKLGLVPRSEMKERRLQSESYAGAKLCQIDDIVMNRLKAHLGVFAIVRQPGIVSPDYTVFRPAGSIDSEYYEYLIKSPVFRPELIRRAKGIIEGFWRLYTDDFYDIRLPIPPIKEQQKIVRFLQYQKHTFNNYIHGKRILIELLNEHKLAIISHAVSKGIDPNVQLKPSGVGWLGNVPAHWELKRLKYLAHIKTGEHDTVDRIENGAYPFFVRSQTVERINTYSFDGEAVLTSGDGAGVGKIFHYIDGKFDYHQRVYKFSNFKGISGKFFFEYLMANLQYEVLKLTAKSTVDSVRLDMLQNFIIPIPPDEEQREIVNWINIATNPIDKAVSTAKRDIELINEFRTRIISDIVMGKVDVREINLEQISVTESENLIDGSDDDFPSRCESAK